MTGPKDDNRGDKLGGWTPVVCRICGATSPERNAAKAVEWIEQHLAEEHGIDV